MSEGCSKKRGSSLKGKNRKKRGSRGNRYQSRSRENSGNSITFIVGSDWSYSDKHVYLIGTKENSLKVFLERKLTVGKAYKGLLSRNKMGHYHLKECEMLEATKQTPWIRESCGVIVFNKEFKLVAKRNTNSREGRDFKFFIGDSDPGSEFAEELLEEHLKKFPQFWEKELVDLCEGNFFTFFGKKKSQKEANALEWNEKFGSQIKAQAENVLKSKDYTTVLYDLPKGNFNTWEESSLECAKRELKEETSIIIRDSEVSRKVLIRINTEKNTFDVFYIRKECVNSKFPLKSIIPSDHPKFCEIEELENPFFSSCQWLEFNCEEQIKFDLSKVKSFPFQEIINEVKSNEDSKQEHDELINQTSKLRIN